MIYMEKALILFIILKNYILIDINFLRFKDFFRFFRILRIYFKENEKKFGPHNVDDVAHYHMACSQ